MRVSRTWPWLSLAALLAGCGPEDAIDMEAEAVDEPAAVSLPVTVGVTTPARDPALWPYSSKSPWNYPLGDGATFAAETSPGFDPNAGAFLNIYSWTHPVVLASSTDPIRTIVQVDDLGKPTGKIVKMRIPDSAVPDGKLDGHLHIIDYTKRFVAETFKCVRQADGNYTAHSLQTNDLADPGVYPYYHGTRAYGGSAIAGLIRQGELVTHKGIKHALAIAVPRKAMNKKGPNGQPYVWPASAADLGWDTTYADAGNVYMGSLLAIPRSVDITTIPGVGSVGAGYNVAYALQHYGAYVVDAADTNVAFYADPAAAADKPSGFTDVLSNITKYLQVVTNNSETSVGGPGNRLETEAPRITTRFFDDFGDGDRNGWSTVYGSWSIVTDGTPALKQSSTSGDSLITAGSSSMTDYGVEAKVKLLSGTSGVGVIGRYRDSTSYYLLKISPGSAGKLQLVRRVSGVTTLLAEAPISTSSNTWYRLKLIMSGHTLLAFFDGRQVLSASDRTFSAGKLGIKGYNQTFEVDDVSADTTTLFADNFEDGNFSDWTTYSGTWSTTTDGTKAVRLEASPSGSRLLAPETQARNYEIETKIKITTTSGHSGIVARYTDTGNYYYLYIVPGNPGKIRIDKVVKNSSSMISETLTPIESNRWYSLKFVLNGRSGTGFLDGTPMVTGALRDLDVGGVGLQGHTASTVFDDVRIKVDPN